VQGLPFLALQSMLHMEHPLEILWMKQNRRVGLRQDIFFSFPQVKFCHFSVISF